MSFYAKLAVFWVAVFAALWLLSRFPSSRISRLAFSWYGPTPSLGEFKSHFLARWCTYALGWFVQILFVFACGYVVSLWFPAIAENMFFLAVWSFALPLLGGTALLGAILAAGASLKPKYIGPNPVFQVIDHDAGA